MKLPQINLNATGIAALVAVLGVAYLVYKTSKATSATVDFLSSGLDVTSSDNWASQAANFLTGGDNKTESIGTRVYDYMNPTPQSPRSTTGILADNFDDSILGNFLTYIGLNTDTRQPVKAAPKTPPLTTNIYRVRSTAEVRAGLSPTDPTLIIGKRKALV